jgi:DNA helicase-2/ATP-dependent DNA helicase PcrA
VADLQDGFGSAPVKMRSADAEVPKEKAAPTVSLPDGFGSGEKRAPRSLERLNDDQREIIASKAKRKLVVAGAGSGKTSGVLLPACDQLYLDRPGRIGIFSFGKLIKEELEEKIQTVLDPIAASKTKVWTNHAIGLRMVMNNLEELGLPKDTELEGTLWKMVAWLREQTAEETRQSAANRTPHFRLEFGGFSDPQIKALLAIEETLIANGEPLDGEKIGQQLSAFKPLEQLMRSPDGKRIAWSYIHWARTMRMVRGKLMFRDLLPLAALLPDERFRSLNLKHILVDEAQDLSADQHAVMRKLSNVVETTLFVGDPAQCIYRFSGSRPDLFMGIKDSYQDVQMFTMGVNYRCDEPILDLANHMLKNVIQSPVRLSPPEDRMGGPIETGNATGKELCGWIEKRIADGEQKRDIVVLTRTNAQLLTIELALTRAGITYNCWKGSLFEHQAVDDFLAYVRFLASERSASDWSKIVTHIKFLGKKTADDAWDISQGDPLKMPSSWYPSTVKGDAAKKRWFDLTGRLRELRDRMQPREFGSAQVTWPSVLFNQLKGVWLERWPDDPDRLREAEEIGEVFVEWASEIADPIALLDQIETMSVQDPNGVVLSTLHKFKGLERNSVVVWNVGMGKSKGLFPRNGGDAEEEACIFYVAVTRARHHLLLLKNIECAWPYGIDTMFCQQGLLLPVHGTQKPCVSCPYEFSCLAKLGA